MLDPHSIVLDVWEVLVMKFHIGGGNFAKNKKIENFEILVFFIYSQCNWIVRSKKNKFKIKFQIKNVKSRLDGFARLELKNNVIDESLLNQLISQIREERLYACQEERL